MGDGLSAITQGLTLFVALEQFPTGAVFKPGQLLPGQLSTWAVVAWPGQLSAWAVAARAVVLAPKW